MSKRHAYIMGKLKTREESEERYIEGYFAVFGQETELWPGWYEQIEAGAFENSLKNNDIRCLFNHDSGFVLGRKSAGTLELREDGTGLFGWAKINPADRQAMDVYARVERGDISGCSFGFTPVSEEYEDRDGEVHWIVKEADTSEVSVVTFPAYPQTEIQARKQDAEKICGQRMERRRAELKKRLEGIKC